METYVFNANAAKRYQAVMSGGGIDRYIFNAQDGNGIGSFFGPILKAVLPVAKTLGSTIMNLVKPAARAAAREGIKGMGTMALGSLADKTIENVQRSRKTHKRKSSTSTRATKDPKRVR